MKIETVRTLVLLSLCAIGGLLVGFNAAHLTNGLNVALFVIGLSLIALSNTLIGLFATIWKNGKPKE